MNPSLRDRLLRKLDTLPDERAYQVLDYVEFLESKYAERQNPPANVFQRFAETVEDRLRAGRVSTAAIAETMTLMNRAVGILNGVAAAGKSVASDIAAAAARPPGSVPPAAPPGGGVTGAPGGAQPAPPAAAAPAPPVPAPAAPPVTPVSPPSTPTQPSGEPST
jgi:hypothetical protein